MTIDSRFNQKSLRRDLLAAILSVFASVWTFVKFGNDSWPLTVSFLVGAILVGVILWLARLKRVSIWNDEIELTPLLFPFVRRHYRFRDFDYMISTGEEANMKITLVRDYQTVLTLKASVYENFDELRQALRIPERSQMTIDPTREVTSKFVWWYPLCVVALVVLVGIGVAGPVEEYLEKGAVSGTTFLIGGAVATFFLILLVLFLSEFKRITVWQGHIEVTPLFWPFARNHYQLSDFDGVYYVTDDSSHRERWYMRNGRRLLCIAENVYRNYEELASATRTNYLGEMKTGLWEELRASFGKTYYIPQNIS